MTPTPNPTAEQAIAEALQDMWPDSTLFGDPWSPESHEVVSIASKLRTHGLLSEGAPSEEQIERAARALFEDPNVPAEYTWEEMVAEDPSRADIWRDDARRVLTAAGVAPQEPSDDNLARASAWSDYRSEYGVHGAQSHRDFCAGWDAARGVLDIGRSQR